MQQVTKKIEHHETKSRGEESKTDLKDPRQISYILYIFCDF